MKLAGQVTRVDDVTDQQRDEMFALMQLYYENMDRSVFESDLAEKDWVIQLVDPRTGVVRGFSTQMWIDLEVPGRSLAALFSGDTIVHHEFWANNPLAQTWGRFALALIDANPDAELYWFLISKGYKTYRFLPVFFDDFYPRHDVPTPAWARTIIDILARARYPEEYDPAAGVIRATTRQYWLRVGLADITPERLADCHVRFFQARNPGHVRGDELCCLAPLTRTNFTRAAYRVIGPEPVLAEAT